MTNMENAGAAYACGGCNGKVVDTHPDWTHCGFCHQTRQSEDFTIRDASIPMLDLEGRPDPELINLCSVCIEPWRILAVFTPPASSAETPGYLSCSCCRGLFEPGYFGLRDALVPTLGGARLNFCDACWEPFVP